MKQTYLLREMEVRASTGSGIGAFHGFQKVFKRKAAQNTYPKTIATLQRSSNLPHDSQVLRHSAKSKATLRPLATINLAPWQAVAPYLSFGKRTAPAKSQKLSIWFLNFLGESANPTRKTTLNFTSPTLASSIQHIRTKKP